MTCRLLWYRFVEPCLQGRSVAIPIEVAKEPRHFRNSQGSFSLPLPQPSLQALAFLKRPDTGALATPQNRAASRGPPARLSLQSRAPLRNRSYPKRCPEADGAK